MSVIEIRTDTPADQAIAEVAAYFKAHHGETIFPSDLAVFCGSITILFAWPAIILSGKAR